MTYAEWIIGGPTPLPEHHVLTLYGPERGVGPGCEDGEAVDPPVEQWEPMSYVGYQSSRVPDGETPECFAHHRIEAVSAPLGVILVTIGPDEQGTDGHSIIQPCFSGDSPAIGTQVVSDGNGCVRVPGTGEAGVGEVMRIADPAPDGTKRLDLLI